MSDTSLSNDAMWQEGRDLAESIPPDEQPRSKNHDDYLAQGEDTFVEPRQSARNVADVTTSDVAGGGDVYDPGGETIDAVKAYIDANPDQRATVLEAEQAGKNRSTLVDWLSAT